MYTKIFSLVAFASRVWAQSQGLAETLQGNNQTSALAQLLGASPDLVNQLNGASNITLLAPSNDALAALLNNSVEVTLTPNADVVQALLQYHVLNGTYTADDITNTSAFIPTALTDESYTNVTGGQRVEAILQDKNVTFFSGLLQNSSVVQGNVNFTGGVIHIIDRILTIPTNVSSTLIAAGLTSLYGALNATELLDTVNGLGDITIFAPSNSAFQSIGSGLANLSTSDLQSILTYHAVNGSSPYYSSDLSNNTQLQALSGQNITIHAGENGALFANGARVVTPNILIAGGVVHVIDNVLNPNSTSAAAPTATSGTAAFSGASSVSDVPFTSGVSTPTSSIGSRPTGSGEGGGGTGGESGAASSTSSGGAVPMKTGAIGAAALFGAGAALINL